MSYVEIAALRKLSAEHAKVFANERRGKTCASLWVLHQTKDESVCITDEAAMPSSDATSPAPLQPDKANP